MSAPHFSHRVMRVEPSDILGKRTRTGTLSPDFTALDIAGVLGFGPDVYSPYDQRHVTVSWCFLVGDAECVIWSHAGTRWAVYDPAGVIPVLFGMKGGVR